MKTLAHLLKHRTEHFLTLLLLAGVLTVLKLSALLSIVNGARLLVEGQSNTRLFILCIVSLVSLFYLSHVFYQKGGQLFESFIVEMRTRISLKIAHLSLEQFEKYDNQTLENHLYENINTVADFARNILASIESAAQVLGICICLIILFPSSFFLLVTGFGLIIFAFVIMSRIFHKKRMHAFEVREHYLLVLEQFLQGFKSLKMNPAKMEAISKEYVAKTHAFEQAQQEATLQNYYTRTVSDTLFFITVFGIITWLMFHSSPDEIGAVLQVFSLLLFAVTQIITVITRSNSLTVTDISIQKVWDFEEALDQDVANRHETNNTHKLSFTQELTVKDLQFTYPAKPNGQTYTLGPIDFSLRKGELVFIVGGNGSGKSTFLKSFTRLYHPQQGIFSIDGQPLEGAELSTYSNLFSVIFTDFHLFDRLYGLEKVKPAKVNKLIKFMGLQEKTTYDGFRFSDTTLSTGQRKRLALISAFLDNRAIYIFDEVAADQDPEYRKFYYETVLPDMKLAGKTVIVVSHDDHYFHVADRVLEMKNGQLHPINLTS